MAEGSACFSESFCVDRCLASRKATQERIWELGKDVEETPESKCISGEERQVGLILLDLWADSTDLAAGDSLAVKRLGEAGTSVLLERLYSPGPWRLVWKNISGGAVRRGRGDLLKELSGMLRRLNDVMDARRAEQLKGYHYSAQTPRPPERPAAERDFLEWIDTQQAYLSQGAKQ
jgi:hypothetical protein